MQQRTSNRQESHFYHTVNYPPDFFSFVFLFSNLQDLRRPPKFPNNKRNTGWLNRTHCFYVKTRMQHIPCIIKILFNRIKYEFFACIECTRKKQLLFITDSNRTNDFYSNNKTLYILHYRTDGLNELARLFLNFNDNCNCLKVEVKRKKKPNKLESSINTIRLVDLILFCHVALWATFLKRLAVLRLWFEWIRARLQDFALKVWITGDYLGGERRELYSNLRYIFSGI